MSTKHSEAMRKRWADPAYRAAKLAAMRSPEFEKRKQSAVKEYWENRTEPHHALGKESSHTLKATHHPSQRDLAWAAGFLEGEGNFSLSSRIDGTTAVTAYQKNPEPVQRMLGLFGGALVQRKPRRGCPNGVWVWRACGSRGRGIAMTLYVMMSTRRQGQIREALGYAK